MIKSLARAKAPSPLFIVVVSGAAAVSAAVPSVIAVVVSEAAPLVIAVALAAAMPLRAGLAFMVELGALIGAADAIGVALAGVAPAGTVALAVDGACVAPVGMAVWAVPTVGAGGGLGGMVAGVVPGTDGAGVALVGGAAAGAGPLA